MHSGITNHIHETWSGTHTSNPELYFQPASVEEVQEIINKAREENTNVVVCGARHSPSKITMTSGYLVNLDKLNKLISIEEHDGYTDVHVEAGIRLKDATELLATKNLALQNLGSISEQSIAGVISTGTHGASYTHGLISEQIVSLDIVLESGRVITVSDNENKELFSAVLLGLGAFGIIVRAKLRCIPAYNVKSRGYVLKFDDLLQNDIWSTVFLQSEYHRIWWYPYSDKVYVWQGDKTKEPAMSRNTKKTLYHTKVGRFIYELLLWCTIKLLPCLTPLVEKWSFAEQFDENKIVRKVGRHDTQINMDCMFKQVVNEWSLPATQGPEMLKELRTEILQKNWYVHAPIEIRISNTTLPNHNSKQKPDGYPGPIYGNITRPLLDPSPLLDYKIPGEISIDQLTMNINATMFRAFGCDPNVKEWFATLEALSIKHGGKPHWAKNFEMNVWTHPCNREKLHEWKKLHEEWAPNCLFGSLEWLESKYLI
ncbi:hypothetical protein DASB73_042250 [Starmerella bacillaris]|uniref:D-arabinono-1,4-lactone oxidase n=1 Tax=Starmerella bacillaris TaxID=1247836 RepID=A0AAV5RQ62_STABA|nr:hypothetical protein DASB73_042250 [Starmerella bacillaris]